METKKGKEICSCGAEMTEVMIPTIPIEEGAEPKMLNGYYCEKCDYGHIADDTKLEINDFTRLRERILKAHERKDILDREIEEMSKALRKDCKHQIIIECPYEPDNEFFHAQPPSRRCAICNLVENGWDTGYKELKTDPIKEVPRIDFYQKYCRIRPLIYKLSFSLDD